MTRGIRRPTNPKEGIVLYDYRLSFQLLLTSSNSFHTFPTTPIPSTKSIIPIIRARGSPKIPINMHINPIMINTQPPSSLSPREPINCPLLGYVVEDFIPEQVHIKYGNVVMKRKFLSDVVLDPLFWQALGKALGWKLKVLVIWDWNATWTATVTEMETWRWYAHQYFDLLLTGGDQDKFWKELLTSPQ